MPKSQNTKSTFRKRKHPKGSGRLLRKSSPPRTKRQAPRVEPVWKGPTEDGITQSLLCEFINCRERFRVHAVEGLVMADSFNHYPEYGQMWHVCEEAFAEHGAVTFAPLTDYTIGLSQRYMHQREQINHWYRVCKTQFPIYAKYWAKHADVKDCKPLLQEQTFCVPYRLPDGRQVFLRGKWDGADSVGAGRAAKTYLQENKTKGDIKEELLRKQLGFDIQTMFYAVAFDCWTVPAAKNWGSLAGIRYNVVRRPLSGGRGSIRRHQPTKKNPQGESLDAFYKRLGGIIAEDPSYFFMRWRVELTEADLRRFQVEFLDPILMELCYWWEKMDAHNFEPWTDFAPHRRHWRTPYGVYNTLSARGETDLDHYIETGNPVGLEKTTDLFSELA